MAMLTKRMMGSTRREHMRDLGRWGELVGAGMSPRFD